MDIMQQLQEMKEADKRTEESKEAVKISIGKQGVKSTKTNQQKYIAYLLRRTKR